jgi:hypothetical protein
MVLTMLCNTQNYWVFGLCPSSGIPETREQLFGNWICFRPHVRGEIRALLRPLERANLRTETDPVSETLCCLLSRLPDDRQSLQTQ